MACIDDVGRHVETLGGEVDVRVELVAPVAVVAEALQTDDENGWQRPEVELLRRLLVLLALWTVPEK